MFHNWGSWAQIALRRFEFVQLIWLLCSTRSSGRQQSMAVWVWNSHKWSPKYSLLGSPSRPDCTTNWISPFYILFLIDQINGLLVRMLQSMGTFYTWSPMSFKLLVTVFMTTSSWVWKGFLIIFHFLSLLQMFQKSLLRHAWIEC